MLIPPAVAAQIEVVRDASSFKARINAFAKLPHEIQRMVLAACPPKLGIAHGAAILLPYVEG